MTERDYSGVPLWRKLGLGPGSRFQLRGPAAVTSAVRADLPPDVSVVRRGHLDVALSFVTDPAGLAAALGDADRIVERGGLWIGWPKKTSRVAHRLDFELVQGAGLALGWVDNKTCRIDDDWQAIRFVRRRAAAGHRVK